MNKFEVAPDFIKRHFQEADRLCVTLIHRESGAVKQEVRSAKQITEEGYQRHLRAANAQGADIYVTVNSLNPDAHGRTKADIAEIRHVYLDIDHGGREALDRILNSEKPPHYALESSPNKFQILWKVEGFTQEQAEATVRGMAHQHGADAAVFDSARVLRVPGFRNHKYPDPHYVREVEGIPKADRIYTPADFPQYEVVREVTAPAFGSKPVASRDGVDQSARDYGYAMRQLEKGIRPEQIEREIADYRRSLGDNKHADLQHYSHTTVSNAIEKYEGRSR